jgi:hypothetical protein
MRNVARKPCQESRTGHAWHERRGVWRSMATRGHGVAVHRSRVSMRRRSPESIRRRETSSCWPTTRASRYGRCAWLSAASIGTTPSPRWPSSCERSRESRIGATVALRLAPSGVGSTALALLLATGGCSARSMPRLSRNWVSGRLSWVIAERSRGDSTCTIPCCWWLARRCRHLCRVVPISRPWCGRSATQIDRSAAATSMVRSSAISLARCCRNSSTARLRRTRRLRR